MSTCCGASRRCPWCRNRALQAAIAADRVLAEDHPVLGRIHRERAQVEQFVVQRAQGQAVGLDVRPADVVPLDVRGFQARTQTGRCAGRSRRRSSGTHRRAAAAHESRGRAGGGRRRRRPARPPRSPTCATGRSRPAAAAAMSACRVAGKLASSTRAATASSRPGTWRSASSTPAGNRLAPGAPQAQPRLGVAPAGRASNSRGPCRSHSAPWPSVARCQNG